MVFGEPIWPEPYKLVVKAGWMDKHQAYEQMMLDVRAAIAGLSGVWPAKRRQVSA